MKQHLIECGVSAPSQDHAIAMDVHGDAKNVNLRIDYISRTMLSNLPDLLIDLLEVATYVYCADQRLGRGSDQLSKFGENWRRSLRFSIPVRELDVWQDPEVQEVLVDTLGFLSDDSYVFDFRQAEAPVQPKELYFHDLIDPSSEHDDVALFSGGIDSFAGAVTDLVANDRSLTLVGHYSSTKVRSVQEGLVAELKSRGHDRRLSYIPVWVSNEGVRAREFTQRTRSFLFACLGLVVARMSGKDSFSFYENGVVSINLPLAGDVVGGRATRTTHPKVLRGLEQLFSLLLDRQIQIKTPLQWLTKMEVTQLIAEAGMADLLDQTVSCTRPRKWTGTQKHCGVCSQCIDRRFGILAAGLGEHEPSDRYMRDLLLDDRSNGDDLRMALAYVSLFKKVSATTKERFLVDFPEIVSAVGHFSGVSTAEAGDRLFDLFQRHSRSVEGVISAAVTEHSASLYRSELPATSLLATCYSRGHVEVPPPSNYDAEAKAFMDRLTTPVLEFAFDDETKRVLFRGDLVLEGANFRLVDAMIEAFRTGKKQQSEVQHLQAHDLAEKLGVSEQSMRQQLRRLREAVEPLAVSLGIPMDQDTVIQTKERAGYRINPQCREVAIADIMETVPLVRNE
ncbi:7-cyano-7-deazaguanine synthase [Seohaeicola saemankumensis]|nr:7-cyano-7-deazaguanine synthase [Seohaeicola saemankumensis]MCA0871343.1 7-cyano-7-deazaguanine synthase [Seohaeicola saemankumensis]